MNLFKKVLKYHKYYFISLEAKIRVLAYKNSYKKKFIKFWPAFKDKYGLEIGGPSNLFSKDILPIYPLAANVDGCNYSSNTV